MIVDYNITPIVLAMDYQSVQYMNALVCSIFENIPHPHIYIITDKPLDEYPPWVYKHSVLDLDIKTNASKWGKNMFLKLYIDVCFPELEKCIYLDFDTIVCYNIGDMLLGNDWILKVADHRCVGEYCKCRINSGVMAFHFTEECKKILEECRSCIDESIQDEVIIQQVFNKYDKITYVDESYNVLAGYQYHNWKTPKIIHYMGVQKPWQISKFYHKWFDYNEKKYSI